MINFLNDVLNCTPTPRFIIQQLHDVDEDMPPASPEGVRKICKSYQAFLDPVLTESQPEVILPANDVINNILSRRHFQSP